MRIGFSGGGGAPLSPGRRTRRSRGGRRSGTRGRAGRRVVSRGPLARRARCFHGRPRRCLTFPPVADLRDLAAGVAGPLDVAVAAVAVVPVAVLLLEFRPVVAHVVGAATLPVLAVAPAGDATITRPRSSSRSRTSVWISRQSRSRATSRQASRARSMSRSLTRSSAWTCVVPASSSAPKPSTAAPARRKVRRSLATSFALSVSSPARGTRFAAARSPTPASCCRGLMRVRGWSGHGKETSRHGRGYRRVRLRHRRRRHARAACSPTGSRRTGAHRVLLLEAGGKDDYVLDPHPGRLPLHHRQSAHRLVLQDRARAGPQRPRARLCARQGARRLLVDQRDDLHARPGGATTTTGAARQSRLVAGTRCCRTSSARGPRRAAPTSTTAPAASCASRSRACSWEILDAWRDAAAECGIPKVDDFNRGDNFGSAYFQVNQRRGVRWSAATAFLRPALQRPNLHRRSPTRRSSRHRVRRRAARVGVEIRREGAQSPARAGAARGRSSPPAPIGSPQLLQLSGIGAGDLLAGPRHRRSSTSCPAWARTCRTTCRSA